MPSRDIESLIRLAADDELTTLQAELLKEYLSESDEYMIYVHNSIDFERKLKDAVSRCMQSDRTVPVDLPFRVRAILAENELELASAGYNDINNNKYSSNHKIVRKQWFVPSGLAAGIMIIVSVSLIAGLWGNRGPNGSGGASVKEEISDHGSLRWILNSEDAVQITRKELGDNNFTLPVINKLGFNFDAACVTHFNNPGTVMQFNYSSLYNDLTIRVFRLNQDFRHEIPGIDPSLILNDSMAYYLTTNDESDVSLLKEFEINLIDSYMWFQDGCGYLLSAEVGNDIPDIVAVAHAAGMPNSEITSIIIEPGN